MKNVVAESQSDVAKVKDALQNGKHVFVLIYMEGCGPCNATRPIWKEFATALQSNPDYQSADDVVVMEVNKDLLGELPELGGADAFPTLRYLSPSASGGEEAKEEFEESGVKKKTRSVDAFTEWVGLKTGKGGGQPSRVGGRGGGKKIHEPLRMTQDTPENLYVRLKRAPTPGVVRSRPVTRTRTKRSRRRRHTQIKRKPRRRNRGSRNHRRRTVRR